ncbi:MAG: SDR family oxidoreductase [Pseudomonadota bacterium]
MSDLQGKAALITGASRGIGLATAHKLAALGVDVALAARNEAALADHCDALTKEGARAIAAPCDVASFAEVRAAVDKTVAAFGRLDILVNNAGVIDPIARIAESDVEEWSRAVDVNVKGVYHGLRAALPVMQAQGAGVIVNMSSGAANSALEGWSHYCATKAAAKKLTECAHTEVGDMGIRIVGLSPGTVATDMMAKIKASGVNPVSRLDWSSHIPPEWAAEAVAFLCGPGGADFAGQDFSIKTEEGRKLVGLPVQ